MRNIQVLPRSLDLLAVPVSDRRRTAQRLLALATVHGPPVLEQACANAILWGDPSPQTVRNFVQAQLPVPPTPVAPPCFARSADDLCRGMETGS
jgi:hypothetical protein